MLDQFTNGIVIKVGGSLFDWPGLRPALGRITQALGDRPWVVVPGGGDAADVVRQWHRTTSLQEIQSHWLAIRMMTVNAHFLAELMGYPVGDPSMQPQVVLDAYQFCQQHDDLPHSWRVTSDSIAARVAQALGDDLLLLKSTAWPGCQNWPEAVAAGVVDDYFQELAPTITVHWQNLRADSTWQAVP